MRGRESQVTGSGLSADLGLVGVASRSRLWPRRGVRRLELAIEGRRRWMLSVESGGAGVLVWGMVVMIGKEI